MKKRDGKIIYSPSDLTNFMESRFVSFMDRLYLEGDPRAVRDAIDESMQIIRERGIQHEKTYLDQLKANGADVCEIDETSPNALDITLEAMKAGRQYIYQAHLAIDAFFGKCDFLVRVDNRPSELLQSSWSYEPYDTKLSLKPKPYFAIQLCAYAEMLNSAQGVLPKQFAIVLGDKNCKLLRTEDYFYFYQQLKAEFLEFHKHFDPDAFPEEIDLPAFCVWKEAGERIMEERDDLCRVANITRSQIVKLKQAGISTLTALATTTAAKVERLSDETFHKLRNQARLQLESKDLPRPKFELLPPKPAEPRRGLALLPPASANDIWFDMEGYPHVEGGLEYLFGAVYLSDGKLKFFDCWAHDREQEQKAFEQFVGWAFARFKQDPNMHIYHYAPYEPGALRRLMGKFGSREFEVDQLLRHNVLVDLYTVVRQAICVGEPRYSIKNIEHLYRGKREGDVSTAMDSVVWYYKWLEDPDGKDEKSSKLLGGIRDYNIEDCESTYELTIWLRELQSKSGMNYLPPPPPGVEVQEDNDETSILARELLARSESNGSAKVDKMLAHLLHFHKREEKPIWWALFDKRDWTHDELYRDLDSIAGLTATNRWSVSFKKSLLFEFSYDADQETKIDVGDTACFYHQDGRFDNMTVKELDTDNGKVALTSSKVQPYKQINIVKKDLTGIKTIRNSIFKLVSDYCSGQPLPPALAHFLERKVPRLHNHVPGNPIISEPLKDLTPQVIDVIRRMDNTTLCIQGPPGSGKTHTGAESILALLADGKTVGVASNSHKAIEVMLHTICDMALQRNLPLNGAKIGQDSKDADPPRFKHPGIAYVKDAADAFGNYRLFGGTAYAFSREDAVGKLDYLFIDEAGQVSVANLVGMSRATDNIVLLGDQMQLEQPVRGSHPGDSGLSTLQYYLQEYAAIPADLGVFLGITRRLHPSLCQLISSAIYEDRLFPDPSTAERTIINPQPRKVTKNAGLLFEAVEHAGCIQSSEEEAERIRELIEELRNCQLKLNTGPRPINPESDILLVAPYNKQVRLLKQMFPEFKVGTVDKFQGKQAPVVIISMADSDARESARGLDFLFSKNRLNVAISRAEVLAIVVANPSLAHADCNSLHTMSLVNLFCRLVADGQIGRKQSMATSAE